MDFLRFRNIFEDFGPSRPENCSNSPFFNTFSIQCSKEIQSRSIFCPSDFSTYHFWVILKAYRTCYYGSLLVLSIRYVGVFRINIRYLYNFSDLGDWGSEMQDSVLCRRFQFPNKNFPKSLCSWLQKRKNWFWVRIASEVE